MKKTTNLSAVIQLGAKQYLVKVGDKIEAEKVPVKEGESLTIKEVLLVSDGEETTIGTPFVEKASVELKHEEVKKGEKVEVRKFRAKSRYRRESGHRQSLSALSVTGINLK